MVLDLDDFFVAFSKMIEHFKVKWLMPCLLPLRIVGAVGTWWFGTWASARKLPGLWQTLHHLRQQLQQYDPRTAPEHQHVWLSHLQHHWLAMVRLDLASTVFVMVGTWFMGLGLLTLDGLPIWASQSLLLGPCLIALYCALEMYREILLIERLQRTKTHIQPEARVRAFLTHQQIWHAVRFATYGVMGAGVLLNLWGLVLPGLPMMLVGAILGFVINQFYLQPIGSDAEVVATHLSGNQPLAESWQNMQAQWVSQADDYDPHQPWRLRWHCWWKRWFSQRDQLSTLQALNNLSEAYAQQARAAL